MVELLVVGAGGFAGAIARYGLSGWVHRWLGESFPYGTLVVNVLGCLVIGGLMALVEYRQIVAPNLLLFIRIGLLGSFTTFSTLGYETFAQLRDREYLLAAANVGGSIALGLGAVVLGWFIVRAVAL